MALKTFFKMSTKIMCLKIKGIIHLENNLICRHNAAHAKLTLVNY